MECVAALKESAERMDEAIEILKRKGQARALKKSSRVAAHGFVVPCVVRGEAMAAAGAGSGLLLPPQAAIISVCSETDFAARTEHFQRLCRSAQQHLHQLVLSSQGALLGGSGSGAGEEALAALREKMQAEVTASAAVLGENVVLSAVTPLPLPPPAETASKPWLVGTYVHGVVGDHGCAGRLAGVAVLQPSSNSDDSAEEEQLQQANAVAQHFVATSGEDDEGAKYVHREFFGGVPLERTGRVPTVGQWLKQHRMTLVKSMVLEFGAAEPIFHEPPHQSR